METKLTIIQALQALLVTNQNGNITPELLLAELEKMVNLDPLNTVPVILFVGESNGGGKALNTDLTAEELAASDKVQILFGGDFVDLDIGTNNLENHYETTAGTSTLDPAIYHGWENGLNLNIQKHSLNRVHLIKLAQGGSVIADWDNGDFFADELEAKLVQAETYFETNGIQPVYYIWMSFGINDAIAGTDPATFRTGTEAWIGRIRTRINQPNATICLTSIMSTHTAINAELTTISSNDEDIYLIDTSQAGLEDANHWDADGMKLIANDMFEIFKNQVWQNGFTKPVSVIEEIFDLDEGIGSIPAITGVTWGTLTEAVDSGGGRIDFSTTTGSAVATATIPKADPFEILVTSADNSTRNGAVVWLDDDSAGEVYSVGAVGVCGFYVFSNDVYEVSGGAISSVFTGIGDSDQLKMIKSGNDVLLQRSTDGISFSTIHTFSGVLTAAPTDMYIKSSSIVSPGQHLVVGYFSTIQAPVMLGFKEVVLYSGSGSPEGSIDSGPAIYINTNGGAGTTLYVKETLSGASGWSAK